MKAIVRYFVVSSALLLSVWILFGVQIRNRSIYSHLSTFRDKPMTNVIAQIRSEFNAREQQTPKRAVAYKPQKVAKAEKQLREIQDNRVAKLKIAARKANALPPKEKFETSEKSKKIRIDDRISVQDEKALDELLTARLDRLE